MLRIPLTAASESAAALLVAASSWNGCTQTRGMRRTTCRPPGTPPKWEKNKDEGIDELNKKLLVKVHASHEQNSSIEQTLQEGASLLQAAPEGEHKRARLDDHQRRVGLLVKKIGMMPQWTNAGNRILCTLLEVPSNHVVSITSPEEWFKKSLVGKRKAFARDGPWWKVTVGAGDADPWRFTTAYRSQFDRYRVPVKQQLGSFIVSEELLPKIGQQLDARHFSCGQYVTASGKTIDWGFQGGMHRWGMKGQPARRTTKSHRRIGSVGSVGDARIWPGKRMPGHMGWEWRTVSGIQIVRMNLDKQVIYVKGCVPGDMGEWLLLKDCLQEEKRPEDIPFPTWTPSLEAIPESADEADDGAEDRPQVHTDKELFIDKLFRFSSRSLQFTDGDSKKAVGRDKTKAKIAKIKK